MTSPSWFLPPLFDECQLLGPFMREHEVKGVSGVFYFSFGVFLVVVLYPPIIAILSVLFLSCIDPLASAIGILVNWRGFRLPNGKSVLGMAGAGMLSYCITWFVLGKAFSGEDSLDDRQRILISTASLFAAICEVVVPASRPRPFPFDDNLIIPFFSAPALYLAFHIADAPLYPLLSLS